MSQEKYPNQYRPVPETIWERIRSLWELYRRGVGLEGDIEAELRSPILDPLRRAEIESLKVNREVNLAAWHSIASQTLEESKKSV